MDISVEVAEYTEYMGIQRGAPGTFTNCEISRQVENLDSFVDCQGLRRRTRTRTINMQEVNEKYDKKHNKIQISGFVRGPPEAQE